MRQANCLSNDLKEEDYVLCLRTYECEYENYEYGQAQDLIKNQYCTRADFCQVKHPSTYHRCVDKYKAFYKCNTFDDESACFYYYTRYTTC